MWIKKGVIFVNDSSFYWNKTHAQVPILIELKDRVRMFYASRDSRNRSYTSFVDFDKEKFPEKIIYIHNKPILDLGSYGSFDESGIMPTSCVLINGKYHLYYIGWKTNGIEYPFENAIGVALSDDCMNFYKYDANPIITKGGVDKFFTGTFHVMRENGFYRGFYLSCFEWIKNENGSYEPVYDIKYTESENGFDWKKTGVISVALKDNEGGISSCTVLYHRNIYKMLFSVRGKFKYREDLNNSYRISSASSVEGRIFQRDKSDFDLEISEYGWDSEMVAYPYVLKLNNKIFLFYNGNGFGKTGIGYASWE